jgi:ABC transporter ATM
MDNINSILTEQARTSIFIAHRLKTVVEAGNVTLPLYQDRSHCLFVFLLPDLILVLQDGQVVEQGTHDELLQLGGLYHSMWLKQSSTSSSSPSSPLQGPEAVEHIVA